MDDYLHTFEARGHEYNEATSFFPMAREAERNAVLTRLACCSGQRIIDAPAGGGYVAEGLNARMGNQIEVICVEPSPNFAAAIGDRFKTLISPIDRIALPDSSVDGIVSLAGLHHIGDKSPLYREWARLIRDGGRLAVGDVSTGTGTGDFLNIFVNEHTPGGHEGIFIAANEFRTDLAKAGFTVIEETLETVPWQFPDLPSLGKFCKSLFAIETANIEQTIDALSRHVGISMNPDGTALLNWQLRYATAIYH